MRDPRVDPRRLDVVPHIDGGSMYVRNRLPKMVEIQRRPFGDSTAFFGKRWILLSTFRKWAATADVLHRAEDSNDKA